MAPPKAAPYHLRLLGPFECAGPDGAEIGISAAKQRGVLAYLALAHGKRARRDELAAVFWADRGEAQARQSLRQCLSALRKLLDRGQGAPLSSEGSDVGLDAGQVQVDVDEVLGGLSLPEDAPACGACHHVRGPLLQGMVFGEDAADDFVRDARVRLQDAGQRLLLRCAAQQAQAGQDRDLIETYWRLLRLNPASEEGHRGLMETYARLGRRSEALAQYQACEDALRRHLDASPSPETVALLSKLRGGEAGISPMAGKTTSSAAVEPPPRAATLPLPDKPSIAIMPFDNLSRDPARDYLCDGFADDITTALSQFSSLCVMSRSSTFALRDRGLTTPELGRQLGVHHVLQGSAQFSGERVRVSTQLVEAEHGAQVWSQRNEGTLGDVFDFQDELVQRVVATVAGRVEAAALARARRKATDSLDAYDCVLRGRYHHHLYTPRDSDQAIAYFEEALRRNPDYPLACGWLACAIGRAANFRQNRAERMRDKSYLTRMDEGLQMLERIETIDDEETECLRLIGEVYLFRRRYDEAEHYLRRAHALNPNDDRIQSQMAALLCFIGDQEEAERFARQAIRSNPFHPSFYQFNLGRVLMLRGKHAEAAKALRAATPTQNRYRAYLAACYAALGDAASAAEQRDAIYCEEPAFNLEHFTVTFLYRDPQVSRELRELMQRAGLG
jgi:TolB-like protein/DNA-binding SARP family transcriptional activator